MIEITFWGVRGTNPVSGMAFQKIGCQTACVSLRVNNDQLIIFDAGSGLYDLGKEFSPYYPHSIHILLTHLHMDHIMGLPFFLPLWDKKFTVNIYSQNHDMEKTIKERLIHPPLFPIAANASNSNLVFHNIAPAQILEIESSKISTIPLNHPGGATGYKLEAEGRSICYITDVEHDPDHLDEKLIEFVNECDIFIYDASYTEEEFQQFRDWGHSTHIRAAEIARAAAVKQLYLFHQNPTHDDLLSERIEKEAQVIFKNTNAAYQRLKLQL